MNASILLLTSAMALGADAPLVVSGTGCGGCGTPAVSLASACPTVSYAMPSCSSSSCGPRIGLFTKLKAHFASKKSTSCAAPACASTCAPAPACAPAPTCAAPAPACAPAPISCGTPACSKPIFTGFTTSCADPCKKASLLDRLRAKFHGSKSCDACAAPMASACCGSSVASFGDPSVLYASPLPGCATSYGTVGPAPTATPAVMPSPTPGTTPAPTPAAPPGVMPKKDDVKKDLSSIGSSSDLPRIPVLGGTSGKY